MAESDAKHQIDHEHYPDSYIRDILSSVRIIAVVGASQKWNRPSYFMAKYLQSKGYRIVPVNPGLVDQEILGEHVYASLKDIPFKIDMVDIFRNSEAAGPIAEEAVEIGADVVWMQLGVRNDKAAETAEKAGLKVVMNRCPKIEFSRLYGELSWHGFDSNVISSKRRAVGTPSADKAANPMASPRQPAGFETRAIHLPAHRRTRPPGPALRQSTKPPPMCSRTRIMPPRFSTCRLSAISMPAFRTRRQQCWKNGSPVLKVAGNNLHGIRPFSPDAGPFPADATGR